MNKDECMDLVQTSEWGKIMTQVQYNDPAMVALAMFRLKLGEAKESEETPEDRKA